MLILSSTSATISVVTGSAGTIDLHASYVDSNSATSPATITPYGPNQAPVTTATTTTIVGSPGASTITRNVQTLIIKNADAAVTNKITVNHFDGTNTAEIYQATLPPGYAAQWVFGRGWTTYNASGAELTASGSGQAQYAQEINVASGASSNAGPTTMANGNVLILWGSTYSGAKTQNAPASTGTLNEITIKDTSDTIATTGAITFAATGYSPGVPDDGSIYVNGGYGTWADTQNGWQRVK